MTADPASISSLTDELLYEQLSSGDSASVDELVRRYYVPLRGYFLRMAAGNLDDADDLVQEAFIRVLRFKGAAPVHFKLWIYTVARNLAYDRYRSAQYRCDRGSLPAEWLDLEVESNGRLSDPLLEEDFQRKAEQAAIRDHLSRLPGNQREIIILRFYQQLKLEEIAQITGSPLGTVKSRLFNGLRALKEILQEVQYAPE
jgi:RNA polymerase sigma-70 factor, ECF subfamily